MTHGGILEEHFKAHHPNLPVSLPSNYPRIQQQIDESVNTGKSIWVKFTEKDIKTAAVFCVILDGRPLEGSK